MRHPRPKRWARRQIIAARAERSAARTKGSSGKGSSLMEQLAGTPAGRSCRASSRWARRRQLVVGITGGPIAGMRQGTFSRQSNSPDGSADSASGCADRSVASTTSTPAMGSSCARAEAERGPAERAPVDQLHLAPVGLGVDDEHARGRHDHMVEIGPPPRDPRVACT